jgi:hypothetical protein
MYSWSLLRIHASLYFFLTYACLSLFFLEHVTQTETLLFGQVENLEEKLTESERRRSAAEVSMKRAEQSAKS